MDSLIINFNRYSKLIDKYNSPNWQAFYVFWKKLIIRTFKLPKEEVVIYDQLEFFEAYSHLVIPRLYNYSIPGSADEYKTIVVPMCYYPSMLKHNALILSAFPSTNDEYHNSFPSWNDELLCKEKKSKKRFILFVSFSLECNSHGRWIWRMTNVDSLYFKSRDLENTIAIAFEPGLGDELLLFLNQLKHPDLCHGEAIVDMNDYRL